MIRRWSLVLILHCLTALQLPAAECQVDSVEGLPPAVDANIAAVVNKQHLRVRLDDVELCEIWTTKVWSTLKPGADQADASIRLPLVPGSLAGVIRVATPCTDLREQQIPSGTYTLRYALQPTFEAHRDTHESRDFLLLLSSSVDTDEAPIGDADRLIGLSAESVQASHPAFLPLLKSADADRASLVRRDERDPNGWILTLDGRDAGGRRIPMDLILLHATSGP